MSRRLRLAVVGSCWLLPGIAAASNMTHPRTPVVWDGGGGECQLPELQTPCMTLHDRSQDPTLHLPYNIPYPDLEVTPDEVADSRRHQFFAFCRQHSPQDFLPVWITDADVASAELAELLDPGTVEPADIMEHAVPWQDCWYRINADVDRRPISCEMAAAGVEWDTSAVPAGSYAIEGYTYEPVFNIWVLRPGVVKVHDGDPDAVGPAAAVMTGELTPYKDDVVMIDGCVDAVEGTTYSVSYAVVAEEIQWVEYAADQPVAGETFEFEFAPPEALAGESGMIKVDFTDPMDRTWTAYMRENIIVINANNPNGCQDDGGSFIGGPCAEDSGGSDEATDGGTADPTTGAAEAGSSGEGDDESGDTSPQDGGDGPGPKSCACTSSERPTAPLLVALFGAALIRRRRAR